MFVTLDSDSIRTTRDQFATAQIRPYRYLGNKMRSQGGEVGKF
jgi:hypothetical protein